MQYSEVDKRSNELLLHILGIFVNMDIQITKDKISAQAQKLQLWQKGFTEKVNSLNQKINETGWTEEYKQSAIDFYLEKIEVFEKELAESQDKKFVEDVKACGDEPVDWLNKITELLIKSIADAKTELKEIIKITLL